MHTTAEISADVAAASHSPPCQLGKPETLIEVSVFVLFYRCTKDMVFFCFFSLFYLVFFFLFSPFYLVI